VIPAPRMRDPGRAFGAARRGFRDGQMSARPGSLFSNDSRWLRLPAGAATKLNARLSQLEPSDRFRAHSAESLPPTKIRMLGRPKFVLASGSPRRLSLLNQAGIEPDALRPADVDETPKRGELPRACANRLARAKADAALKSVQLDDELRGAFILAADTVVAVGRRILPKANLVDEASQCLRLLSGRNHRVYTAICLVTPKETFRQRLIETRVRFKRLSEDDIQAYIGSGEWRSKAGGYAVQGIAGSFVVKMVGSYTNIVGLPLYETMALLGGEGFPVRFGWLNAS
jgi:septum formation protein